jgi:hypothetical protein
VTSPNPRITDAIWWFWIQINEHEEDISADSVDDLVLGGIYADKTGYHNTRNDNPTTNYSVRDAVDKRGPGDKAAAIDLTFRSAQSGNYSRIALYSRRLYSARRDPKLRLYLREFYGNTDDDTQVEGWDFRYGRAVTSDKSHLWHIHISFTREYVNSMEAMRYVYYIMIGGQPDVELTDKVNLWDEGGNKPWRAGKSIGVTKENPDVNVAQLLQWGGEVGHLTHNKVLPSLARIEATLKVVAGNNPVDAVRAEFATLTATLVSAVVEAVPEANQETVEAAFRNVLGSLDN